MTDGNTTTSATSSPDPASSVQQYPVNYIATLSTEQNVSDLDSVQFVSHYTNDQKYRNAGLQILLVNSDFKVVWVAQ